MDRSTQHSPVILILGERARGKDAVDEWLAASRYSASEAKDVFQVLEQVSDFTIRDRPDVIFFHASSLASDREFIESLVATAATEPDIPIIDFSYGSKSGENVSFENAIAGLACKLDQFIPKRNAALS